MTSKPNRFAAVQSRIQEVAAAPAPKESPRGGKMPIPPARQGKKNISTYVTPDVHKQLGHLSVELDRPLSSLMIEAMNLLFEAHGKQPIARE